MARCIPDRLHTAQYEKSESDILERLRFELSDDYIVIPCLEIPRQNGVFDSEADFVILHPRGRLVLEVKGGQIVCESGKWMRERGSRYEKMVPPFYQSRDNSYEIHDYLVKVFGKESPEGSMVFDQAIVFPDVDFNVETIEVALRRIVDRKELAQADFSEICERLLDDAAERYLKRFPGKKLPEPLTSEQLVAVAQKLRPDFRLTANLTADEMDIELIRLSASQLHALDMVTENKRLRITGGPGSGKTLLAMEMCRRELQKTPTAKIGLICFNRYLGGFLYDVVQRETLTTVTAGSFYSFCDTLIGSPGDQRETNPEYYAQRVRQALVAAKKISQDDKYDLLVVDEGQDFRDDGDMLLLMDTLLKGGLKRGRWRWFEDLDQYLNPEPTQPPLHDHTELLEILDEAPFAKLDNNWRNTEQIAQKVAKVMGQTVKQSSRIFGPAIATAPLKEGKEFAMLDALIQKVVLKDFDPKDVVIISMHGAGRESYKDKDMVAGLKLIPYDPMKPYENGTIRCSTVYKFKGMESHAVVLTDFDKLDSVRDRRKAYVGMSRARYALYMVVSNGVEEALKKD